MGFWFWAAATASLIRQIFSSVRLTSYIRSKTRCLAEFQMLSKLLVTIGQLANSFSAWPVILSCQKRVHLFQALFKWSLSAAIPAEAICSLAISFSTEALLIFDQPLAILRRLIQRLF